MPYKIRGVIGLPQEEGKYPLILISHGSHENIDVTKRFDTGFTYLVEELARNGFIAVSMDMSMAYIWKYGDNQEREKQEEFLINYCIDFFDKSLFDKPIANKMYGLDVESMYKLANSLLLIDANSVSNLKPDKAFIESELYTKKPLINIRWEEESEVSILPKETDFSKFNKININLVMDLADDLNQKDKPFTFSILLSDNKDNKTTITLASKLNALEYGLGEMETTYIEDLEVKCWSSLSPIAGIDIPLNEFDNIDLKNIKDFALIFDKTSSGSLYIESIYLQ